MIAELPTTREEFEDRFKANIRVRGVGESQVIVLPCPFCAARDWFETGVEELGHPSSHIYCTECGRSGRLVEHVDRFGTSRMDLVHTAGPDIPDFLPELRSEVPAEPDVTRSSGYLPPTEPSERRLPTPVSLSTEIRGKGGKQL